MPHGRQTFSLLKHLPLCSLFLFTVFFLLLLLCEANGGHSAGTAAAQCVMSSMPAEGGKNTPFCTTTFPPYALRGSLSRIFPL